MPTTQKVRVRFPAGAMFFQSKHVFLSTAIKWGVNHFCTICTSEVVTVFIYCWFLMTSSWIWRHYMTWRHIFYLFTKFLTSFTFRNKHLFSQDIPTTLVDLTQSLWCKGYHSCLPPKRSGFDSRVTQCFFKVNMFFCQQR